MTQLRKRFADAGLREQERKVTYALKREDGRQSWERCTARGRYVTESSDGRLANCFSYALNRTLFDWTCQYGMSPERPVGIAVLLWLACSLLYFAFVRSSGAAGALYRIYSHTILEDPNAKLRVERISRPSVARNRRVRGLFQSAQDDWALLRTSMFFSLMSAFNIGFRDINFGRWLRLLTREEFDIKAVGWVRVIAGWQSLISVLLLALWVLTYFGRPFG